MIEVATADYSGGSLNSLNGAILVKSCERAMYCVIYSNHTNCTHVYEHKHSVTILTEKNSLIGG